jgi:5-hydroxyisourate hydrolase
MTDSNPITTHVLDLSSGRPANGVPVILEFRDEKGDWRLLGQGATDANGRLKSLLPDGFRLEMGTYRLQFDLSGYYRAKKMESLYPEASVVFTVRDAGEHYHLPLLLTPHGYTTYRGS